MQKINFSSQWSHLALKVLIFMMMLVIIMLAYPHKSGSFAYRFEVGRPWTHGLITAQYDFPIYKSDEQVREEQQEALRDFAPYFNQMKKVGAQQLKLAEEAAKGSVSREEMNYLRTAFRKVYEGGIISVEDFQRVKGEEHTRITVVNQQHKTLSVPLSRVSTPRMAYDSIVSGSPLGEQTQLRSLGLNRLLLPNLVYDSVTTASMLDKLLDDVTETHGIVQKGEKIIDRGEIVDAQTYTILSSLKRTMEERGIDTARANWMKVGIFALFFLFTLLMALYLYVFRPKLFSDIRSVLFFCILISIVVVIACLVVHYTPLSIYIVPFAWVPIIIRVFYDSRTALFMHILTVLFCAFLAPVPIEFLVVQIAAGMVCVLSLQDMAQRSQLFQTTFWILLSNILCYTACILVQKGGLEMIHWHIYLYFLANALLVVCSYIIIFIFEKTFRLVSSVTLVELTNVNSDLMLAFAEKAPGSFQHSLQVSNLAMEAAKRIGANALLVRTGALYHDIGKMSAAGNFIENQQGGLNPLSALSFEEAAKVVIAHVQAGVEIAEEHGIPEVIISFIRMHHGSSKTRYFYNSYVNSHPGEPVDESIFQYPGPKPNTKETAIVMMADAVEARSRSMQEYTEESISAMVDHMINLQIADGQLEDTPLTFHDIQIVKQVFTRKLISMNHHRIAYPELKF